MDRIKEQAAGIVVCTVVLLAGLFTLHCASFPRTDPEKVIKSEVIYLDGNLPVRRFCFHDDLIYLAGYDSAASVFVIQGGCKR